MVDEEFPDAVIIVGPPQLHEGTGVYCLKKGLHVFVEKPPSLTLDGARGLVEAIKASGRICMVEIHWRHMPVHRALKTLSEQEVFGEVFRFEATYLAPDIRGAWGFLSNGDSCLTRRSTLWTASSFSGGG